MPALEKTPFPDAGLFCTGLCWSWPQEHGVPPTVRAPPLANHKSTPPRLKKAMEAEEDQFLREVCLLGKHNLVKQSIHIISSHCWHYFPLARADKDASAAPGPRALSSTSSDCEGQTQDDWQQHGVVFPTCNKFSYRLLTKVMETHPLSFISIAWVLNPLLQQVLLNFS